MAVYILLKIRLLNLPTYLEKSLTQSNYHHGDLKAALIAAAEKILKEKGIEALSLRTIAAEVGVSHMAPYAHFKNKSELFQSIAAAGYNAMADRMKEVGEDLSPPQRILAYGTAYIEFALANAPLYRLMLSQTQFTGPEKAEKAAHLSNEVKESSKRPFDMLEAEFGKFIDDNSMRRIRAQGAWSLVHGMAALIIDGHLAVPKGMTIKSFLANASMQMPH